MTAKNGNLSTHDKAPIECSIGLISLLMQNDFHR